MAQRHNYHHHHRGGDPLLRKLERAWSTRVDVRLNGDNDLGDSFRLGAEADWDEFFRRVRLALCPELIPELTDCMRDATGAHVFETSVLNDGETLFFCPRGEKLRNGGEGGGSAPSSSYRPPFNIIQAAAASYMHTQPPQMMGLGVMGHNGQPPLQMQGTVYSQDGVGPAPHHAHHHHPQHQHGDLTTSGAYPHGPHPHHAHYQQAAASATGALSFPSPDGTSPMLQHGQLEVSGDLSGEEEALLHFPHPSPNDASNKEEEQGSGDDEANKQQAVAIIGDSILRRRAPSKEQHAFLQGMGESLWEGMDLSTAFQKRLKAYVWDNGQRQAASLETVLRELPSYIPLIRGPATYFLLKAKHNYEQAAGKEKQEGEGSETEEDVQPIHVTISSGAPYVQFYPPPGISLRAFDEAETDEEEEGEETNENDKEKQINEQEIDAAEKQKEKNEEAVPAATNKEEHVQTA
ncbi:hypothetical protein QOT17_015900 [Balamuthia mandrillaris]